MKLMVPMGTRKGKTAYSPDFKGNETDNAKVSI